MSRLISANDLKTGTVVFLRPDGAWVGAIGDAAVFADKTAADAALDAAARSGIVDPLVIERKDGVEGASAMTLRNAIRAFGPTIDYMPASSRTAS